MLVEGVAAVAVAGDSWQGTIAVCGGASAVAIRMHSGEFFPMAGGHQGTVMKLMLQPFDPVGVAVASVAVGAPITWPSS